MECIPTISNTFDCGSDTCICCHDNFATLRLDPCGHRQLCLTCFTFLSNRASQSRRPMKCPTCKRDVATSASCHLQLRANPIGNVFEMSSAEPQSNSVTSILPVGHVIPTSGELVRQDSTTGRALRETLQRMIQQMVAGKKTAVDIREYLAEQPISANEMSMIWVALASETDAHAIICKHFAAELRISELQGKLDTTKERTRAMIRHLLTVNDIPAYVGRGVLTASVDTTLAMATVGTKSFANETLLSMTSFKMVGTDALCSVAACVIFCGVEILLWGGGVSTWEVMVQNCKEHSAGCGGAVLGGVVGGVLGFIVGGPASTFLGSFAGGLAGNVAGRIAYRHSVNRKAERATSDAEEACAEEIRRMGRILGIDVDTVPLNVARMVFRERVYSCHPDKFQSASPEERARKHVEAAEVIAAWNHVRAYYKRKNVEDPERESFIQVWVVKVRDALTNVWTIARSYFDSCEHEAENENLMVQQLTLYF